MYHEAKLLLFGILIATALLWGTLWMFGGKFDSVYVEGRLSAEQAGAVNALPWGHCPGYRDGDCHADEGDRVVVREFSELMRTLQMR